MCTVNYSFNGDPRQADFPQFTEESQFSVVTGERYIGKGENYNPYGFRLSYVLRGGTTRQYIPNPIIDWYFNPDTYANGALKFPYQLLVQGCRGGISAYNPVDKNSIQIDNALACPSPNPPPKECWIKVFDANGALIFQDTGSCPVSYTVACGCPEGTLDCNDCCLNCDSTFNSISEIRGLLSRIK